MKKFDNSQQKKLFEEFKTEILNLIEKSGIEKKSKFNFHFMDFSQEAGQDLKTWKSLEKLFDILRHYSEFPLLHWTLQKVGGGKHHVLEIYGQFPKGKSDFSHPKHVPDDVLWARFRLGNKVRVVANI